jgi:hypothetical protein
MMLIILIGVENCLKTNTHGGDEGVSNPITEPRQLMLLLGTGLLDA